MSFLSIVPRSTLFRHHDVSSTKLRRIIQPLQNLSEGELSFPSKQKYWSPGVVQLGVCEVLPGSLNGESDKGTESRTTRKLLY
jgi:hypothetical protein